MPGKSSDFRGSGLIPRNLLLAGCFGRHPTVIRLGSFPWVDRSLFSRKNISKSRFSCLVLQKQDTEMVNLKVDCYPSYIKLTSHSKPFDFLLIINQQFINKHLSQKLYNWCETSRKNPSQNVPNGGLIDLPMFFCKQFKNQLKWRTNYSSWEVG